MEAFSPLDRFLLFATVGGMFASLAFYAAQRTARFWKEPFARFTRASRAVQTLVIVFLIAVTAIGGNKGGTNDPPMRAGGGLLRTIPAEDLPSWFVGLGYPATDADASGIPDCWEKWTHTSGMPTDADPDGDGLTNLDEFGAQTDPIRADTDGDGIDDATELAGLAAGVADLDPATPATFAADEPDADGDGIPDLWEDSYPWTYEGVDANGFPLWFDFPAAGEDNYDVRATVSSSRHALLSWGGGEGSSILLPPCTNLALRLRLSADDMKTLALSPSPNASTNPVGTWRGAVVADWDERRGLPTEDDRVAVPNGTMVDRSERESVSVEAWMPQPALRSGGPTRGRRRGSPEITFTPRTIKLIPLEGSCRIHGPDPLIQVVATNAAPPYVWTEGGVDTITDQNTYRAHYAFPDGHFQVSCRWRDSHSSLFVSDSVRCDPINCRPGRTNFVGACWYSTHNPTNAADHAPGISEEDVVFGPLCPVAHDVNVKLGWTHNTAILWIRNLVRIVTGDPMDDETDHCFGMVWTNSFQVNLESFLDPIVLPFRDKVLIRAIPDGIERRSFSPPNNILVVEDEPNNLRPIRYHIELVNKQTQEVLDRMWLMINSGEAAQLYSDWLVANASISWTTVLPAAFEDIALITNGTSVLPDPSVHYPGWKDPKRNESLLHHDAVYEMRSEHVGDHGHQATYDSSGRLIRSTIAAGTADYFHPLTIRFPAWTVAREDHYRNDVVPFLRALNLDGNPGIYNSRYAPTNLDRPCIRQGTNTDQYINRRPILPGGTTPRTP